jgi:DNA-binding transcriptional regulator GbsR (MarR family)
MNSPQTSSTTPATRDERRVSRWIEEFAGFMVLSGIPRMPARVLVCLMADDRGALTSAELSERLKISPAAVSGAIRYLTTVHMVRRTRQPGSRREIYQVDRDVIYQASIGQVPLLARWEEMLRDGIRTLGAETESGQRLAESAEFIHFVTQEMDGLLERWDAHKARQKSTRRS